MFTPVNQPPSRPYLILASAFPLLLVLCVAAAFPADSVAADDPPGARSPLDQLDPTRIPVEERAANQLPELVALIGSHRGRHGVPVESLVFSPDGKRVASGGDDFIRLWDTATLREVATLKGPYNNLGRGSVVFAPNGKTLAAAVGTTLILWDLSGAKPRQKSTLQDEWGVSGKLTVMAFAPDGATLAWGNSGGSVRLWDMTGKDPERSDTFRVGGPKSHVQALAFTPDGRTLLAAAADEVVLWDVRARKDSTPMKLPGQEVFITGMAFAPDGKTVASCGHGNQGKKSNLRLWNLSGDKPKETLAIAGWAEFSLKSVAFAPDGKTMAVGDGRSLRFWDLSGAKAREKEPLKEAHALAGSVQALAFAPNGKTLASGDSIHGLVCLWDLSGDTIREVVPLTERSQQFYSVQFALDGKTLITTGPKGAGLWNLAGDQPRERPIPLAATRLALSPDGKTMAASKEDGVAVLWDVSGDKPREQARLKAEVNASEGILVFSPDSKTLATGSPESVQLWDLAGAEPKARAAWNVGATLRLRLAFAPDGKRVAGTDGVAKLWLWDLGRDAPRPIARIEQGSGNVPAPSALAFAPDGKTLVGHDDAKLLLWDLTGDKPVIKAKIPIVSEYFCEVVSVTFTPNGKKLVWAESAGQVVLWDLENGKKVREWELPGKILDAALAPDGRHLAVVNQNGAISILRLLR